MHITRVISPIIVMYHYQQFLDDVLGQKIEKDQTGWAQNIVMVFSFFLRSQNPSMPKNGWPDHFTF